MSKARYLTSIVSEQGTQGQALLSQGPDAPPVWGDLPGGSEVIRVSRTSNTALTTSNSGNLIDITSGTFTQTFDAAATLGNGWFCYIRNSGTGDITLDPNGSETIDGLTSYVMYPGEVRLVQCDGTGFNSVVLNAFAKTFTASGTFTKPPGYSLFSGRLYGAGGGGGKPADAGGNGGGGGGGACVPFHVPSAVVSSSTTVTIGSGGAGATSMGATGGTGGDSTFGAFVTAYGGGGGEGGSNGGTAYGGGGGGSGSNGALFSVRGGLPSSQYFGDSQLPTLGGGGGGRLAMNQNKTSSVQGCAEWGGAGGSAGSFNSIYFGPSSIYGGGGGGGGVYNQSTRPEGGSSGKYLPGDGAGQNGDGVKAGSGGRGGSTSNLAGEAGGAPSGGGGGGGSNGSSAGNGGNGGRGELRIWGVV